MSFDNIDFETNPNFKFKEYPAELRECLGSTYVYDVFKSKEGKTILISPYWNINKQCNTEGDPSKDLEQYHYISLIDLQDNKEIKKLVKHKDRVITCRFFENPFNKKQYFISADRKCQVVVWDLSDDCKIIFDENVRYDNFIYSVLMFFDENKIYVVTSTLGNGETLIYTVGDKVEPTKIEYTKDTSVYYLDYWNEKKDDGKLYHYIIQLVKNSVIIHSFTEGKEIKRFDTGEKYANNLCGMVYKKNGKDLLITSATRGLIQVIDLESKQLLWSKEYNDVFFYNFVKWNENIILLYDAFQRRIFVLDTNTEGNQPYKIISKVLCPEMFYDKFIKKVNHPVYGESLLSIGVDWRIKLWVNRNVVVDDVKEEEKKEK